MNNAHKIYAQAAALIVAPLIALISYLQFVGAGPDYLEYYHHYAEVIKCFECTLQSQGYLFSSLLYLFSIADVDFVIFYYVLILILIGGKIYLTMRVLPNAWAPALLFYFSSFFILHDLIQIRLSVAIALAFTAAYSSFFLNKKIFGAALVFLSVLVHASLALFWLCIAIYYLMKASKRIHKIFIVCLIVFFTLLADIRSIEDLLKIAISWDYSGIGNYAYELIEYSDVTSSYFSIYTIDALLTATLSSWMVKHVNFGNDCAQRNLINILNYMVFVGFAIKIITIGSPVVSFRLFELFAIGLFVIKGWMISVFAKRSISLALTATYAFTLVNIYVFVINGPFFK